MFVYSPLAQYIDGHLRGAVFRRLLRLHDVGAAEEDKLQRRIDAAVAEASAALPHVPTVGKPPVQVQVTELGGDSTRRGSVELALQYRTGAVAPAAEAGD